MQRTLIVIPNPLPGTGGAETHYMEIVDSFVKMGIAIVLVCAKSSNDMMTKKFDVEMSKKNVRVARIPVIPPNLYTSRGNITISLQLLAFWIASFLAGLYVIKKYNVRHCLLRHSILLFPVVILLNFLKVNIVADGHLLSETNFQLYFSNRIFAQQKSRSLTFEHMIFVLFKNAEIITFSCYATFRAYSPIIALNVEHFLKTNLIRSAPQVVMIPPSVDPKRIRQMSDSHRKVRGVAYFGVLESWWDVDTLVKSFSLVFHHFPNIKLYIYGDGPLAESIEKIASESSASQAIFLYGAVPREQILRDFSNFDIVVVPMLSTAPPGIPIKLIEALMGGKATIVSNIKLFHNILSADDVLFVKTDNVDELAKGIIKIVIDDRLRNRLSINGRKKAMELFNSEKNYQKLLSLILKHS